MSTFIGLVCGSPHCGRGFILHHVPRDLDEFYCPWCGRFQHFEKDPEHRHIYEGDGDGESNRTN